MRATWLLGAALVVAGAATPAGAQTRESPIEFIIGDHVVTRDEVRRPIDQESLKDPERRRKLYATVRRNLAQESLLYQYARHIGIAVPATRVDRAVRLEQRRNPNGEIFARGITEQHGNLDRFRKHLERRQVLGALQAQARYGPELGATPPTGPTRIAFSQFRHVDLTNRWRATKTSLAREVAGSLLQVRFSLRSLPNAAEAAADFATSWRADTDKPVLQLLKEKKLTKSQAKYVGIEVYQDWPKTIFKEHQFPAAYRALSTLKEGDVSEPFRAGNFLFVCWLKSEPSSRSSSPEMIQQEIELTLQTEAFSRELSAYVREALRTTYVWPPALRKELAERHAEE